MDSPETKVYTAIFISALILGVILIYFIFSMIRQNRSNASLYRSKIQAEIITLEKERSRVAQDLHDELAPTLLTVKYNLNGVEFTDPEDNAVLTRTNELLDSMIRRVREISNNLLPDALLRKGLITAIQDSVKQVHSATGLDITFTHKGFQPSPSSGQAVHIFRIIQEIIHNTIKHAQASVLVINLMREKNSILLKTEDDGIGFRYAAGNSDFKGLGLRSLLSRADFLNGTMYLDTKEGKGTRYIFEFPV